jgi:hypothetical protein
LNGSTAGGIAGKSILGYAGSMSEMIKAYAALAEGELLKPFEFNPGSLREEQVEIAVEFWGVCHSDLSMLDNEALDHLRGGRARYRIVLQNDL